MDVRGRRRRNWLVFWLALAGIGVVLALALPALLALLFTIAGFGPELGS